jgi:lipopolysaccharide/colanic/teichoic acid biosynthesis glycosyltransferase
VFDLAITALLVPLAVPLLIVIALAAWMIQGRPVLFRQQRPGLYGKPFTMYKFRTMREIHGDTQLSDGDRLTRFGTFLRSTSLDELPELINVMKGEMSLVGPRPLLMQYLDRYTAEQRRRHDVLPGITGWAQVNGRNALTWEQKFELDLWYVARHSLWVDLKILAMTAWKVLRREGIHHPGQVIMEEFKGYRS